MSIERLKELLRKRRAQGGSASVEARRKGMEAAAFPVSADVAVEETEAAGRRAEWLRAPGASDERCVLYLHGGGYVIGSIATHRALAGEISRASGARVLLVDYRLAPEHPHPAAVDDAVASYRWLLDHGAVAGRTAVCGDSAGGGLTAACLVAARDAALPMPGAAVCISPWSDLTCKAESYRSRAALDPMIQPGGLDEMAAHYLQDTSPLAPLASPNFADLTGLPPVLIHVGSDEVLHDDAVGLHERARAHGVDSTLEVWDGMIHVWHAFHPMLDESKRGIERVGGFLRETWGR